MPATTLLCILDGFGIGDSGASNNAIALANMPNYQRILNKYPHSQLLTSGLAVGLPEGQIGNSEVGHITIGAGRVIYQDLPKINLAIDDGSLATNTKLTEFLDYLKKENWYVGSVVENKPESAQGSNHEKLRNWQINQPILKDIERFENEMSGDDKDIFNNNLEKIKNILNKLGVKYNL